MNNEEASDKLQHWIDGDGPMSVDAVETAITALRSTPPATGAAAMREACLEAVRKCNVIGERGTEGNWFGGVLAALEQAEADIRALPAPDLGELRRLHEAATPGPWERATTYGGDYCTVKGPVWTVAQIIYDDDRRPCTSEDDDGHAVSDTALIAAMRNALPALLSIAEAAEAWLERGSTLDTHAALRAALAAVRKEETK